MTENMKLMAYESPWRQCIEFALFNGHDVAKIEYVEHPRHAQVQPSFSLSLDQAQTLMDDLYHAGLRPTQQRREDQEPIKKHLEDMRTIAFNRLKVEKP